MTAIRSRQHIVSFRGRRGPLPKNARDAAIAKRWEFEDWDITPRGYTRRPIPTEWDDNTSAAVLGRPVVAVDATVVILDDGRCQCHDCGKAFLPSRESVRYGKTFTHCKKCRRDEVAS